VTFTADTDWSTEGVMHWDPGAANPVMTHNLPRWASHAAFDFQYRGDQTLIGVFAQVGLVRSLLKREAGKDEIKVFDKHIFDDTRTGATTPKAMMLNSDPKSAVDQRNLWTWVCDGVHSRARAEFGLAEEPVLPFVSHNYWHGFTIETYNEDLLPAAAAIGAPSIFIDNVKKSAMTDRTPFPGKFNWNMCCGHEYEIAPELGGNEAMAAFINRCAEVGVRVFSWTNTDQALSSPINARERADADCWYVLLEDTRQKAGGAYMGVMSILDFANDQARRYFVDSHIKIHEQTGLNSYLFDSFYNMGFMPVNYLDGKPRTMWRQLLQAIKELQDADVHFRIESFGPFGQVQHGCPPSYCIEQCWVSYKINLGTGYTTVPGDPALKNTVADDAGALYYTLAHMTNPAIPLFHEGRRIDELWDSAHRQALADYLAVQPIMHRRYLQEDGQRVLWHSADSQQAVLWNFAASDLHLPGRVCCTTTGEALPTTDSYAVAPMHTYTVAAAELPTAL
jgi:hypothetical protein